MDYTSLLKTLTDIVSLDTNDCDMELLRVLSLQGNEFQRLEFLGDSIYGLIITEMLYHDKLDNISGIRQSYENYNFMTNLANYLQLHLYFPRNNQCDVLEAFIGWIYLDFGLITTRDLVLGMINRFSTPKPDIINVPEIIVLPDENNYTTINKFFRIDTNKLSEYSEQPTIEMGRSVIRSYFSDLLYLEYPDFGPGLLSLNRSTLVKADGLVNIMRQSGLCSDNKEIMIDNKKLVNAFKYCVGIVAMRNNISVAFSYLDELMAKFDWKNMINTSKPKPNNKNQFNTYCQKNGMNPVFNYYSIGPPHAPIFSCHIIIDGNIIAEATGASKAEAKNNVIEIYMAGPYL
jgi:dsRNA-specific ribonuclease